MFSSEKKTSFPPTRLPKKKGFAHRGETEQLTVVVVVLDFLRGVRKNVARLGSLPQSATKSSKLNKFRFELLFSQIMTRCVRITAEGDSLPRVGQRLFVFRTFPEHPSAVS